MVVLTAGCATQTRQLDTTAEGLPLHAELDRTPFFPQNLHQCGPASLATGLSAAGYPADPQGLEALVYLPKREGSLQPEMLAAARRRGALALPSPDTLVGLLAEVAAGTPVIVLQNLGLAIAPRWHYAVVIGYDRMRKEIILRSGMTRREVMAMRTFEHTWARSGNWGMMVLRPPQLPIAADRMSVEKSLAALEKFATPAAMSAWYEHAIRRWPHSLSLTIGLGNTAFADGRPNAAEQAFRMAAERHPKSAVALNNLATVLHSLGRLDDALQVVDQAVALADEWQPEAVATRDAIQLARHASGERQPHSLSR
jgi:hypothetical protein